MRIRPWLPGIAAALVAACAAPAAAQDVQLPGKEVLASRPYEPVRLPQPAITLGEAVMLTLRHDPEIVRGAETLRGAYGRYQETRGLFDPRFRLSPSASYTLQQLTPAVFGSERDKRETIRVIRDAFTEITDGFRRLVAGSSTRIPLCPTGLSLDENRRLDLSGGIGLNLNDLDPVERLLLGQSGLSNTNRSLAIDLDDIDQLDLSSICSREPRKLFSPDQFIGVYREVTRVIDQSGGRGLEGIIQSVSQIPHESWILQEQIYRTVAERADLALARLGPVAQDELKRNTRLDVSLTKPFRSGLILSADFQMQSQEHNFVDKPLDPAFGGLGTPPQFFSSVWGTVTLPIGRGRGSSGTAAPERSSQHIAASEEEQLRHVASEEVFRTVLSYLDLIAAQERLKLLEGSAARQQQILKLSQARVNAGELAQSELGRVQARAASVDSSLALARAELVSARVALAETIGVSADSVEAAPVATEMFNTTLASVPEIQKLIDQAMALRRDTRAAAERREASALLFAGARADSRWLFDVDLTVGMSNLYDSPFFRYFPDEREPIIDQRTGLPTPAITGTPVPRLPAVRYFDPRGFKRAISGRYEPFATIRLTWEIPFGNNAARGRVAQAQANLGASTIDAISLDRIVKDNIVEVTTTMSRAATAVDLAQTAATNGARTLESALRLFQTGDVTLIDTLTTEEGLIGDELLLLRQRQTYLSALARLKFEIGELVLFDNPRTAAEVLRFLSTDFVGR